MSFLSRVIGTILGFVFLFPLFAIQADEKLVEIDENFFYVSLGKRIDLFEDSSKTIRVGDFLDPKNNITFKPSDQDILNFGISNSAFWYRINLKNKTQSHLDLILEHTFALVDSVIFFIPDKAGNYSEYKSGNFTPLSERTYPSKDYVIKLRFEPDEKKQIYMRIEGRDSLYSPIHLWTQERFTQSKTMEYMLHGSYFGLIIFLTLYNLLVFLTTRDYDYFYYIFYLIFTAILFQGTINGFINEYIFPEHPIIAVESQIYFYYITLIIYPLMAIHVLNIKKKYETLYWVLSAEAVIATLGMLLIPLFGYYIMNMVANTLLWFWLISIISSAILVYRNGYRPAIFFLIAFVLVAISGLFLLAAFSGIITMNYYVLYGYQTMQAVEAVLMGIALGDKINLFEREKEIAQGKYLLSQKSHLDNIQKFTKIKNKFLHDVSLELLNPLTGIIGIAEYWKANQSLRINEKLQQDLEVVLFSSKRISYLINNIIDLSNVLSNRVHIGKDIFNFTEILSEAVELYSGVFNRKGVKIVLNLEERIFFEGDQDKIQQVFHNLLSISINHFKSETIHINFYKLNKSMVLDFIMENVNMSSSEIELLDDFNFEKIDYLMTEADSYQISLVLVKKMIELHQGVFNIFFEKDNKLTMRILLENLEKPGVEGQELNEANINLSFDTQNPINPKLKTILIADTDPVNLYIIKNHLGHLNYQIITLSKGQEVLDYCFNDNPPELIIMDLGLSDVSGQKVLRKIREKYKQQELPILVLTIYGSWNTLISFKYGANDFLTKPIERTELLNRVTILLTLKANYTEDKRNKSIKQELQIAKNLQLSLLPQFKPNFSGLDIETRYIPVTYLAGDFFDYHIGREKKIGIVIADVTGHGVAAAMIASMFKTAFQIERANFQDPSLILHNINKNIFNNELYLITACYIFIDLESMTLKTTSAGHPPLWVIRGEKEFISIKPKGRIIGLKEDSVYECHESKIESGDRIFLYTDGITDAINAKEEIIGEERIQNFLQRNTLLPPKELTKTLMDYIYNWSGKTELEDDISFIIVDIK